MGFKKNKEAVLWSTQKCFPLTSILLVKMKRYVDKRSKAKKRDQPKFIPFFCEFKRYSLILALIERVHHLFIFFCFFRFSKLKADLIQRTNQLLVFRFILQSFLHIGQGFFK